MQLEIIKTYFPQLLLCCKLTINLNLIRNQVMIIK